MAAIPTRSSSSPRRTRGTPTNTRWTAGNRWPPGETRRFTTWVFASPARNHYDAQVAAHLAVANAKGWNSCALEAILRNTSLYLLRRNLALDANDQPRDGRYIFISGPGYGWKQWVSDGFYTALGLDDPEKTIEANRAVFWTRMDYEDNAHYYLIWAVLMKRAGGSVNEPLVRKAYEFLRAQREGRPLHPALRCRARPIPRAGRRITTCCHTTTTTRPPATRVSTAGRCSRRRSWLASPSRTSSARLRPIARCSTPSAVSCPRAGSCATRSARTRSTARR